MIIREHQIDELGKARRLQDELAKLHIPSPVLSWQYEIKGADGSVVERGIGKSNSYTRNALNWICRTAGLCDIAIFTASFGDGFNSFKYASGTVNGTNAAIPRSGSSTNPKVYVGISTDPESLDSYLLPTESGLTAGTTSVNSTFNAITRKEITIIGNTFANETGSDVDITESGISVNQSPGDSPVLYVRDVFEPVKVYNGQTLSWIYITEVSFPNP